MHLHERGGAELGRMIRRREVSSREAVEAHLDRIAEENPRLNALVEVYAESALATADQADQELASGGWRGPLHGVPLTVKSNIDVAGSATTQGVVALREAIAPGDAWHVERLRNQGAIVMGRTNMPDWGFRWHTDNELHGATLNPWDPTRTPGGSGGGDAAAVATGMTPIALGNDYGGSARQPAQACGVASIRPSRSLIPYRAWTPEAELSFTIQQFGAQGILARRVEDLAIALDLVAGPHPEDPWSAEKPLARPEPPRRVAVTVKPAGRLTHPDVADGVRRAAAALSDDGFDVDEIDPPAVEEAAWLWTALVATEARLNPPFWFEAMGADERTFVEAFLAASPELDLAGYARALADRQRIARSWAQFQQLYPIVLGPVTTEAPFKVGEDLGGRDAVAELLQCNQLLTGVGMLDLPAAVVPVGLAGGLPQVAQVIAPRHRDDVALTAAAAIEQRTGRTPRISAHDHTPVTVEATSAGPI